jgi:ADP-heptose:LPS heptosyltransferase
VLSLAHMGDLILGAPAIFRLKEKIKDCEIDIVVGDYNVELAKELGVFRHIYPYNFFAQKSSVDPSRRLTDEEALLQSLPDYDIALDLRRPPDTRFLLFKVRATVRAGFTTFSRLDRQLDVCLPTDDVNYEFGKAKPHNLTSISLQLMALVDALPIESIVIPSVGDVAERKNSIGIFPFAGQALKEWPLASFVELTRRVLADRLFETVNLYLSAQEMDRAMPFTEISGAKLHVGLLVPKLIRSVSTNKVVVANNSFGAHLASLLRVPLIGIYGGHETWIEWQPVFGETRIVYSDLTCSPCHIGDASQCPFDLLCLRQISVDKVLEVIASIGPRVQERGAQSLNYVPLAT